MMRWIDRLRLRLRSLVRRESADAELAGELALHIDEQTRENIGRGLSPSEAREAARRAFGSVAVVEEQCRDTRRVTLFQNLWQDLRYGLRSLLRQPLLVIAATASIGVSVAANTLIFSLASELLLAPPSARAAHELVNIRLGGNSHVSYRDWRELEESGALAGLAGYHFEQSVNVRDGSRTIAVVPMLTTANFFDVLGVPVALGRGYASEEASVERDPRMVVVSDRFWRQRLGGDPQAPGRFIVVNGNPYLVLGVLPRDFRAMPGFGLAPEIYLPLSRSLMVDLDHPHAAAVQLVGRLRPAQSFAEGRAALGTVVQRRPRDGHDRPTHLGQFSLVTDGATEFGDIRVFFGLLLGVVALVLGIACANVAGLLLARSTVRQREIAVRVALGASRRRLVQQLLIESLWLALIGTAVGLVLMLGAMSLISRVPLPLPLPLDLRAPLDLRLFSYALALVVLATLFSGLVPAIQATRPSLAPALKQHVRRYVHRRWTLRGLLVTGQVAVSIVLVVTSFLFLRNLAQAHASDPGFDTARTVVAEVGFVENRYTTEGRVGMLQAVIDRVEALPHVERAAYAFGVPLAIRSGRTSGAGIWIESEGEPSAFHALWAENMVSPGYFQTLAIPILRGRDFGAADTPGSPRVIVVNDAFVRRYLPGRQPLGLRLLLPGAEAADPYEIVGVVGNSKHRTIGEGQMAAIYFVYRQRPPGSGRVAHVVARTRERPEAAVEPIATAVASLDPTAAVDVRTMRQSLAFAFLPSRVGAALLGGLGVIGLVLAMAGLFALLSYSVTRRTKEIGVRIALGATRQSVARLVTADAAALVAIGMAIGLALAAFVTQPLAMFLVGGLSPADPVSFAGTALLFALVSAAATLHPMRRATSVDPVVALRDE